MQESIFSKMIDLLNTKKEGEIITRRELLSLKKHSSEYTIDVYRIKLIRFGFLKAVDRGKYKLIKHIPSDLSTGGKLKIDPITKLINNLNKFIEKN